MRAPFSSLRQLARSSLILLTPFPCRLGVTLVAYSPLGRGMIGCDWKTPDDIPDDDGRKWFPRFQGEAFKANMALVHSFRELAQRKGCTPNQLALKWVMDQGALPIPGTKRVAYLSENLKSAEVVITEEEHKELRRLIEETKVEGGRYMAEQMGSVNA